jgi:hypothetical protein
MGLCGSAKEHRVTAIRTLGIERWPREIANYILGFGNLSVFDAASYWLVLRHTMILG